MPCEEVLTGQVYIHDDGGLRYAAMELLQDLTGYETAHNLGKKAVHYIQLQDGEVFPAGTRFVRAEEDFKQQFSLA